MKRIQLGMFMVVLAIAGCGSSSLMPQGKPPIIQSLSAESSDVGLGAGINLKAKAMTQSGNLDYTWQADGGMITRPDGPTVLWLAPTSVPFSPYPVTITLSVKDEFGRSAKASHQIRVHQEPRKTF